MLPTDTAESLQRRFTITRNQSEHYCAPLQLEDYGLQAMPETSPPKWHLAHTTWFFETFILKPFQKHYRPWHPQFEQLFNSYYNSVGEQFPRHQRGLLSRPGIDEIMAYRHAIDEQILVLLDNRQHGDREAILARIELGINHEQQHQELFFTDLKYSLFQNPLHPSYTVRHFERKPTTERHALTWTHFDGGLTSIGHGGHSFSFDNETPVHSVFVESFSLANRLVTNNEYLAFIQDNGYQRPELWLADGWSLVQTHGWRKPLYWKRQTANDWSEYTLYGMQSLDPAQPVSHVCAYEADAFARWRGARLPTEFEWESVARNIGCEGHFVETQELHPQPATSPIVQQEGPQQLFGTLWEWTSSAYGPYPKFTPPPGALGEYNGKFMCNQLVLRGGSCVSSRDHLRASYRNFFYPQDRWQFSGIRLARS